MQIPAWIGRLLPNGRRRALRRFDGAIHNRLTHSWVAAERSINTELRGDLDALRRRSRDLAKNSPLARKFLKMCEANIAGPRGFVLQARAADGARPDELANTAIEAGWADWGKAKHCDVANRLSFRQFTRALVRSVARDGEGLVRLREGAANKYGFALQLLDIERLDTTLNREAGGGKNQIIMGVEMDADGRPVAYWLATTAVGRDPTGKKLTPIPAEEILHIFFTDDPEQVRGIPWMHAAMLTVNDLKGYNHAAIVAARIGASKMGFFTNPEGEAKSLGDGEDAAGVPFTEADPGQFGVLPNGYDFKSFDPDYPHANYAAFVKEHKRDIATGFNVAYNSLANDLEGVNFSSIRSGTLEERENWMTAQSDFIEQFCDIVHDRWLDNALLAGALVMPNGSALPASKRQKFLAHEFLGRRWQWVDPFKDIQAAVLAMENGLADPYTIAAQQGMDAEDVLAGIARFRAAAEKLNVPLGKPEPKQPAKTEPDPDEKAQADEGRMLTMALARAALKPPPAPAAPTFHFKAGDVNVAPAVVNVEPPAVHVAAPAVRVDNHVPAQPAPHVDVRVEAVMPEQPAAQINVNVEAVMPDEMKMAITAMPDRRTTSEIERDAYGEIVTTTQIEKDA